MSDTEFGMETISDAEIEAAWDEEEENMPDDEQETETPADQQEAEETPAEEPEKEETPPAEPKADAQEEKAADQPTTFILKHLDEIKTVDRDEVVKLAQQGMDYERVKTERDQLREYRKEADPAITLLKSYAKQSGSSVSEYIDRVRKQELMASGLNEQAAASMIAADKREAALNAREQAQTQAQKKLDAEDAKQKEKADAEAAQTEKRIQDMAAFIKKYPGLNPKEDIPAEVWGNVKNGETLISAYTAYRNKKLEAELAALKQNQTNAKKSTGSMTTKGKSEEDQISKWWNEE